MEFTTAMAQSCEMDGVEYRRAQGQYKPATNHVLDWLREHTKEWQYEMHISLAYYKTLARCAVQEKHLEMPEDVRQLVFLAIELRQRCRLHHEKEGTHDEGHDFIIEVLENIRDTFGLGYQANPAEFPPLASPDRSVTSSPVTQTNYISPPSPPKVTLPPVATEYFNTPQFTQPAYSAPAPAPTFAPMPYTIYDTAQYAGCYDHSYDHNDGYNHYDGYNYYDPNMPQQGHPYYQPAY